MQETGMVLPVFPGKQEALIAFANALLGERKAEYIASQVTVSKESWFLQPTPMGDLCIVYSQKNSVRKSQISPFRSQTT